MQDPAQIADHVLDWLDRHAFALGFWLCLVICAAAYAAFGEEIPNHPPLPKYSAMLSCPNGNGYIQIQSDDPELVMAYLLVVSEKIGPAQLTDIILAKHPDQKEDLALFVKQCLGHGQGRS